MPFDLPGVQPSSDLETLFKAVGFVVVQWGFAEQSLDLMVATIFHSSEDRSLTKRRPQFLVPKVQFLTDCFDKTPELSHFKSESEVLLRRFLTTGKKRNDLVHSAIATTSLEGGAFQFLKIDLRPKGQHAIRSVFLDDSEWAEFRRELLRLGKDGSSLARKVHDVLKKNK